MMRPIEQTDILDSLHGPTIPYVDPVLKRSRKHVGFIKRLHKIDLAVLCLDPTEFVGLCVVHKNGEKGIRPILDARKINRRFATAPSVSRLSTEGLCGAEVVGDRDAAGCSVAFAVGDINDAFRHMRIDDVLGHCFTVPYRVTAGDSVSLEVNSGAASSS